MQFNVPVRQSRAPSIYEASPSIRGIGIAGAGAIVAAAHLPAYRRAGLAVRAIYDIDQQRARALAKQFQVPTVARTLDELLDDPSIEVLDIAVPTTVQPEIAYRAMANRKHLLCQKPLANSTAEAIALVEGAQEHGITLAVNVNMRWDPAIRETQWHLSRGYLGELRSAEFVIHYCEQWASWPWLAESERLLIFYDTIHIIDIARKLFGDPEHVEARCTRSPRRGMKGETAACIKFSYADGRSVIIDTNSESEQPATTLFSFSGTKGMIRGELGIYLDYPHGRPDSWMYVPHGNCRGDSVSFRERWIPDAFAGTMAELLTALDEAREPTNSGADHVETLRLIDRVYDACPPEAI